MRFYHARMRDPRRREGSMLQSAPAPACAFPARNSRPMVKLIGSTSSPFVRKVRVVLAEKRIDYDFVVDPPSEPASRVPEFNPLGKVPVLVTDDGTRLFDSTVIVEYLDSVSPVTRLIPEPVRQRINVRRWEALADGIMD